MKKKNIYFSQVNYSTGSGKFKGYWFPYSVATIWAYVQQFQWVTENFQLQELLFKRETPEELLDRIEEPHIFCFSNYVWNYEYNKKIAEAVKKKYPNCLISFGGPQVTKFPKQKKFFENHSYVEPLKLETWQSGQAHW